MINFKRRRFCGPVLLAALLLIGVLLIELKHPYFFLQDDNRDGVLPNLVHTFDSLLGGELAQYNFHQFLGYPFLAAGQTGVLYPLNYLAVFLSRMLLGHSFLAVDLLVVMHLLIGALGFYALIRSFKLDGRVAVLAGLSWSFSSFIFFGSDSWVVISAIAAWFPWMIFLSLRHYRNPGWQGLLLSLLPRLALFYVGYIQYFICGVIFEFITLLLYALTDRERPGRGLAILSILKGYVASYLLVLIFSLPLLLPMARLTAVSAGRDAKLAFEVFASQSFPIGQLLLGLFFPFLTAGEGTYASFRNLLNLSHIGYVPLGALLVWFALKSMDSWGRRSLFRFKSFEGRKVALTPFVLPMAIALLWSSSVAFNGLLYLLPIINRFRWPFKMAVFLDFYLILLAAVVLAELVERISWKKKAKELLLLGLVGVQLVNFLFLYIVMPYRDFGEHHGDSIPLEEPLREELAGGRIVSVGFRIWEPSVGNSRSYKTAPTLGFNYATLWSLEQFAGYEPFIGKDNVRATLGLNFTAIYPSSRPLPVEYLRQAGVCWYLLPPELEGEYGGLIESYGMVKRFEDGDRVVFFDPGAEALVSFVGKPGGVESYWLTTNSIRVGTDLEEPGVLVLNYLYHANFRATVDGEPVRLVADEGIGMRVEVPAGEHRVVVEYVDPDFRFGLIVSLTGALGLGGVLILLRVRRRPGV